MDEFGLRTAGSSYARNPSGMRTSYLSQILQLVLNLPYFGLVPIPFQSWFSQVASAAHLNHTFFQFPRAFDQTAHPILLRKNTPSSQKSAQLLC